MKLWGPPLAIVLSLTLAVGVAACGGGGDDDGSNLSSGDNTANGADGDTGAANENDARSTTTTVPLVQLTTDPAEVRAIDNTFHAEGIEVPAGTTVRWTNAGRQDHDVIPADDSADWGAEVDAFHPGATYEHTFTEPGTYTYYCTIHGTPTKGMVGVVVVE